MKDNSKHLLFTYPKTKPATPFAHLINILPRVSLDLLPKEVREKLIAIDSKLKSNYPLDYEIDPIDRAREYAWHAHLPP